MDISKQIQSVLNNKKIINFVNKHSNNLDTKATSNIIGDVFTYCFTHSSNKEIRPKEVLDFLDKVYSANLQDNKEFTINKTNALIESIKTRLSKENIPITDQNINDYFLNNYVKNGYVTHAFPGKCKESILKNGLTDTVRLWDSNEILEISKMFEAHGILFPVGAYSHYNGGGGTYVEHQNSQIYWHALSSPEWLKWFTSSNHLRTDSKLSSSPYFLRDKQACKTNVEDLCKNAKLTAEESQKVIGFFEKTWSTVATKDMPVALISRETIGKNNTEQYQGNPPFKTIIDVLSDTNGEFKEHVGNVVNRPLTADDMHVVDLPHADKFFKVKQFNRETRAQLLDPATSKDTIIRGLNSGFNLQDTQLQSMVDAMADEFSDNPQQLAELQSLKSTVFSHSAVKHTKVENVNEKEIADTKKDNPKDFPPPPEPRIDKENLKNAKTLLAENIKQ